MVQINRLDQFSPEIAKKKSKFDILIGCNGKKPGSHYSPFKGTVA